MAKFARFAAWVVTSIALVLAGAGLAFGQDGAALAESNLSSVDATGESIVLSIDAIPGADPASATYSVNGAAADVVSSNIVSDGLRELTLVVDVGEGVSADDLAAIASQVASASVADGTVVRVVKAGADAQLLNTDGSLASAAAAIESLSSESNVELTRGFEIALREFDDSAASKSIVAIVGSSSARLTSDFRSEFAAGEVRLDVVSFGTSADASVTSLGSTTGGFLFSSEELESTISQALGVSEWAVELASPAGLQGRQRLEISSAGSTQSYGFDAGAISSGSSGLTAPVFVEGSSSFLNSKPVFYAALILAALVIGLGVFAAVNLVLQQRENSIDGVLSSYIRGSSATEELSQADQLIQSAIVKRAVSAAESIAERRGFTERVSHMLERADLPLRAGEALLIGGGGSLFIGVVVGLLTTSWLAGILLTAMLVAGSFFLLQFLARRRLRQFELQLPDTLQLLAGTLRAGYSLPQGLDAVSKEVAEPMGSELQKAMSEAALGKDIEEALSSVGERMDSPDFAWTVMAIGIQREVGGNLNELLTTVADTITQRERLRGEVKALTAEGRVSAAILSFLPPGIMVVIAVGNPEYIEPLFNRLAGIVLLGLGVLSAIIGLLWMKKVITIDA